MRLIINIFMDVINFESMYLIFKKKYDVWLYCVFR